jgi:hypothetical protein
VAGGTDNPYLRCILLKEYLKRTCLYNLQVSVPPANKDFVSWFLDSKEGYCVYFATALTMLCRLSDIPARYVEGYYAPPSSEPDGYRIIQAGYAHAWTEIYLAGIGWIPVDATPGGPEILDPVTPRPTAPVSPDVSGPAASPSPGQATPTPKPTRDPAGDERRVWLTIALIILLLSLPAVYIGCSIRLYKRRHQAGWLRRHFHDDQKLIRFYWLEIQRILTSLGVRRQPSETPHVYLERALASTSWLIGLNAETTAVRSSIETALYSEHAPEDKDLSLMAVYYDELEIILKQNTHFLRFIIHRILRPGLLADPELHERRYENSDS